MPNLTSKELSAIEDQLNMEQLLIKKFQTVAQLTSDPQIRTKFENITKKHHEHICKLLSHLN